MILRSKRTWQSSALKSLLGVDKEREMTKSNATRVRELAFYYPNPMWTDGDWIKNQIDRDVDDEPFPNDFEIESQPS